MGVDEAPEINPPSKQSKESRSTEDQEHAGRLKRRVLALLDGTLTETPQSCLFKDKHTDSNDMKSLKLDAFANVFQMIGLNMLGRTVFDSEAEFSLCPNIMATIDSNLRDHFKVNMDLCQSKKPRKDEGDAEEGHGEEEDDRKPAAIIPNNDEDPERGNDQVPAHPRDCFAQKNFKFNECDCCLTDHMEWLILLGDTCRPRQTMPQCTASNPRWSLMKRLTQCLAIQHCFWDCKEACEIASKVVARLE